MARRARALAVVAAIVAGAVALFALVFAAMDRAGGRGRRRDGVVVIGSKAFTESIVLGEVMAQWIERRTRLRVERRFNLGGTHICFEALRTGAIDLYPEYTGTGLMAILRRPAMADRAAVAALVREEFARRHEMVWLSSFGFDNTYALAVPARLARARALRTISDLRAHDGDLVAGFASEFLARDDGWPGLRARYGLRFRAEPRGMEAGLMYRAAAAGEVDVVSAYSTDGRVAEMDLVVLDDDRRFFPPYEAAPLVRRDALARARGLRGALEELAGAITADAARRMNADVDAGRRTARDVAAAFVGERERALRARQGLR